MGAGSKDSKQPSCRAGCLSSAEATPLQAMARGPRRPARLVTDLRHRRHRQNPPVLRHARTWLGDYPAASGTATFRRRATSTASSPRSRRHSTFRSASPTPCNRSPRRSPRAGRASCFLDTFEQIARHAEATARRWLELARRPASSSPAARSSASRGTDPGARADGVRGRREALRGAPSRPGIASPRRAATTWRRSPALVKLLDGLPLAIDSRRRAPG